MGEPQWRHLDSTLKIECSITGEKINCLQNFHTVKLHTEPYILLTHSHAKRMCFSSNLPEGHLSPSASLEAQMFVLNDAVSPITSP